VKSQRFLRMDAARIWNAALRAADPEPAIRKIMKRRGNLLEIGRSRYTLDKIRKIWVLGAGKAVAPMGRAVEAILGRFLAGGILVTKYGHNLPLKKLTVLEAGHPLPDQNRVDAAARRLTLVDSEIKPGDLVLCLLSGGASSLLVAPAEGISLEDKVECTRLLLNGGADIYELNAVRKHLSRLKGGGLARRLHPTPVVALVLSDVVGDDLGTIASGPLAPDTSTFGDCLELLRRYQVADRVPAAVKQRLELGAAGRIKDTPKPQDPIFQNIISHFVANSGRACSAAAQAAKKLGYRTMILTSRLEGDTTEAARFHMSIAGEIVSQNRPLRRPACIISGGETTVKVRGNGKGGRNQEFALQCVKPLARLAAPCVVASLGTDGTDGPTDAAGALADNTSLTRSLKYGAQFLKEAVINNDSYHFFKRLDDLIVTGPTRTNVMDLHLVLIG